MPQGFQNKYPNTRTIIHCTEIKCQMPSSLLLNSELFSSYKNHTTLKGLIPISPAGHISFISQLYTHSISDKAGLKVYFWLWEHLCDQVQSFRRTASKSWSTYSCCNMGLFSQYRTQQQQRKESGYFTQELSLDINYSSRFVKYPHYPIVCCLPHC